MRYSGADRDDEGPWFTLGKLDVTTTTLVLLAWTLTLLIFVVEPINKPIMSGMALIPEQVGVLEVWRVVTWPWSHTSFGIFDIVGAAILWIFGTDLERQIGRRPFAVLIAASVVIIGLVATGLSLLLPGDTLLAGLALLELTVILLYIAEHPTRPFFFGIPAWVIGAVIAAIELVNDLAYRDWIRFLTVLIAAALISLVARKVDLLTNYDFVPELRLPGHKRRAEKRANRDTGRSGRSGRGAAAESKRPGPLWGRRSEPAPAEIVPMPASRRPRNTTVPDVSADDLALDLLLDKISDGGMDSLTDDERQSLTDLRARRRGRGAGQTPGDRPS